MASGYSVFLGPVLDKLFEQWAEEDQDIFLAFELALADHGFDAICGAARGEVGGLSVEFVEPGETPEMVWARIFLDLSNETVTIRVDQEDGSIFLEVA